MTSEALHDRHALSRARALVAMRRWEDARTVLRHAIAENPESGEALCLLAQCELSDGSPREALRAADAAVEAEPENEWAHRLRSLALSDLCRHRQAARAAEVAVELAPLHWATHARLADSIVGFHGARALAAARRAVELAPTLADAHFSLAMVEDRHGRRRRAIEAYRHALALDPHHPGARDSLGRIDMDRSRFGRAASAFGAVLAQDPAFAPASHNIGVVLHALVLRTWLGLVLGGVALAVVRAAVHPWGAGEAVVAFSLAVLVLGAVCALILVPLRGVSVGTRSYVRSRVRRGALAFTAWTSVLAGVCLPAAVLLPPHPAVGAFPVAGGAAMVGLGALLFDMMCATSASGRAMRLPRGRTDHLRNGVAFVAVNAVAYAAWYLVVR